MNQIKKDFGIYFNGLFQNFILKPCKSSQQQKQIFKSNQQKNESSKIFLRKMFELNFFQNIIFFTRQYNIDWNYRKRIWKMNHSKQAKMISTKYATFNKDYILIFSRKSVKNCRLNSSTSILECIDMASYATKTSRSCSKKLQKKAFSAFDVIYFDRIFPDFSW